MEKKTMTEAPAPKKEGMPTIRERLNNPSMIAEFGRVLPKLCTPERFARVALTAITRTPKLADCDQASFFRCLLDLAQWGLEPDGRRAHLIPFENRKRGVVECQLIIDYKGLVELAFRAGSVKSLHADVVRDGDLFSYSLGEITEHVPWFLRRDSDKPKEPGKIFAVYCRAVFGDGIAKTEVLSEDEVNLVRSRSRAAGNGPWVTDWSEMAKKTAFRRLSKWLPLSAELHEAFERDDEQFDVPKLGNGAAKTLDGVGLADLTKRLTAGQAEIDAAEAEADDRPIGADVVLSREDAWLAFCSDMQKAANRGAANFIYDSYFGPDSKHPWTDEDTRNAASIVAKRREELGA